MPSFAPHQHHRRSIRLKDYDYSQAGAYFVTVVTHYRENLFGEIVNAEIRLNPYGEIVRKWWNEIPVHFPNVEVGAFMIMPNHVHGIIFIVEERRGAVIAPGENDRGGETPPLRKPTLGQIIAYFKYQSTKEMNELESAGAVTKFWQRNYHEHIIRSEIDLRNKTNYIEANPLLWEQEEENPSYFPSDQ